MIVVPDASVILKWVLEEGEGKDLPKALADLPTNQQQTPPTKKTKDRKFAGITPPTR